MTAPAPVRLWVPLAAIVLDGSTQCRADGTDEELVKEYAARRRAGVALPAPEVFTELRDGALVPGAKVWIGDGEHRVRAALHNGVSDDIECDVFPGGEEEAFTHALTANERNGKTFTREDKRNAARRALLRWPHLSTRQIAAKAGLGRTMLDEIRKKLLEEGALQDDGPREGADGKKRRLPGTAPEQPEEDPRPVGLFPVGLGGAGPLPPPPAEPPPTYAPVLPGPAGEALAGLPLQPERKASPAAQTLVQDEPAPVSDEVEKQATPEQESEDDTDDDAPATTRAAAAKPGDPYEVDERIALLRSSAALRAVPEAERPAVAAALVDLARELDPQGSPQIPDWIVHDRDKLSDDVNATRARVRELEAALAQARERADVNERRRKQLEEEQQQQTEIVRARMQRMTQERDEWKAACETRGAVATEDEQRAARDGYAQGRAEAFDQVANWMELDLAEDADEGTVAKAVEDAVHSLVPQGQRLALGVVARMLDSASRRSSIFSSASSMSCGRSAIGAAARPCPRGTPSPPSPRACVGAAEEEAAKARELLALAPALADPEEALRLREDAQDVRRMRVRLQDMERKLTDAELEIERLREGGADPVLAVACPQCSALPGKPCDTCGLRKIAARKAAEAAQVEERPAPVAENPAPAPEVLSSDEEPAPAEEQRHRCYAPGCGRFDTTLEYLPGVGGEEYVCPGHGGKKPVDARVRRAEVVFEAEKFTVIVWGTEYVRRDDAQAALDAAAEKAGPLVVNRTTVRSQEAEGADCYTGSLILAAMPERFEAMKRAENAARWVLVTEGYALGPDMAHRSPCTRCGAAAGQPCTNYKKPRQPTCKQRGLVKLDEEDAPQGELTLERDEPAPAPKTRRRKAVRS